MSGATKKRLTLAALMTGLFVPAALADEIVSANAAPQPWIEYSILLHNAVQLWLADNSDAAVRLNAYLKDLRANSNGQALTVPLAVWISKDGVTSKVGFPSFVGAQANADISKVLENRALPEAPPADMRQPVRLNLVLPGEPRK